MKQAKHTQRLMNSVVRLEYLAAALFVLYFYLAVGKFNWWWLFVLFLVADISAIGYFFNSRVGAFIYNLGHSIVGPALMAAVYIATTNQIILFITLVWLFHIFIDRGLGYGLKHSTSFRHTHLGPIGKAKLKK